MNRGIALATIVLAAAMLAVACGEDRKSEAPSAAATEPMGGMADMGSPGHDMESMTGGMMDGDGDDRGEAILAPDAAGVVTAVARDNYFLFREIRIEADVPVTVRFINQGRAKHNLMLHTEDGAAVRDLADKEIRTPIIDGGATTEIDFSLPEGEYEVMCDLHSAAMRALLRAG